MGRSISALLSRGWLGGTGHLAFVEFERRWVGRGVAVFKESSPGGDDRGMESRGRAPKRSGYFWDSKVIKDFKCQTRNGPE